mgnify:CR=1 FL=1|tara:strand:- start:12 stop:575 length:564 start_codon:yes stop_codon:yes gene_type:complete
MEAWIFLALGIVLTTAVIVLRRRYAEFPGQTPQDYNEGFPAFDLQRHLNGEMICEGVIFGPLGRVTSSFVAAVDIKWEGPVGVMSERFRYNDGTIQDREWVITLGENDHFSTTAADVPGGGKGELAGSAAVMRYKIQLPPESGSHLLNTVDWMYLTPDGTIINRSQFRKYGVKVAELVASIRPKETI